MKMKLYIVLILVGLLMAFKGAKQHHWPSYFPEPVQARIQTTYTPEMRALGRVLFYDPILSADSSVSCASCHNPYTAFAHTDHALSHGIGDSIGKRNAPALFNLAWQSAFMLDGAVNHIEVQALAPLSATNEMAETLEHVLTKLNRLPRYQALCASIQQGKSISSSLFLKSLAAFVLSLNSFESKYDSVKRHQSTFTAQEAKGYEKFKQYCNACHAEPLFTNHTYQYNGLSFDPQHPDLGRYSISLKPKDSFAFKVPSLRNISYTYPYMHDGRYKTLQAVLKHYAEKQVSAKLNNNVTTVFPLSANDQIDIIAFLKTLNDVQFLFNKDNLFPNDKGNNP
jgi:cytochrome c peroxidase